MKVFSIAIAMLIMSASAIKIAPSSVNDVQIKSQSRVQSVMASNNQLFAELKSKIQSVQKNAQQGNPAGANLSAGELNEVVDQVQNRWLGSIDKEEPEIADEFLRMMKDAIYQIHATEGYPHGKVANARNSEDDWLTKIVEGNKKMQALIPKETKEDRVAIADS